MEPAIVCHFCHRFLPEDGILLVVTETGLYPVCAYCDEEQTVKFEEDIVKQEEGLAWALEVLRSIKD